MSLPNKTPVLRRPVVLCILDGWGHREDPSDNAIAAARTPTYDRLLRTAPFGLLAASAEDVGLPSRQMGNSEVGHMNLGAGRTVRQVLPEIDESAGRSFTRNRPLEELLETLQESGGTLHVMGLVSPGGVHSHMDHFPPLVRAAHDRGVSVALHAFTDGRDAPPRSALEYLAWFEREIGGLRARFATVCGRYFTMDRDQRWERVARGYMALAEGDGLAAASAREAVEAGYARGETDEFLQPTAIAGYGGMRDGDGLLMANFRADRARQILSAFVGPEFSSFARPRSIRFAAAAGMANYSDVLSEHLATLFPQQPVTNSLGEIVSRAGLRQLRIAETEKYAHVTFFFNGGEETVFAGEDRTLVPSPKVATYDLKPEMSAPEVTERLVEAIASERYRFILVNYANTDMVGHSGDLQATVRAVETVDSCLQRLETAVVQAGAVMLVTADHGNAELMRDESTGQPHTAHTTFPVPALLVNAPAEVAALENGRLSDIAPTLLPFLGLEAPREMTGRSLVVWHDAPASQLEADRVSA